MKIKIELMNFINIEDIYNFESENKVFFEKDLPPRPDGYFNFESFKILMNEILEEQLEGKCYMYIVRNQTGKMVGRVNLHSIEGEKKKKAELGYRISEMEQGKGYASEAVKLVIEKGFKEHGLILIEAGTSTKNKGSQKVLDKNGFILVGKEEKVMRVNDKWVDGLLYEKYCDENRIE